ncbi:MAG: hypothetical protein ABI229_06620, partial [Gemmatimonadaceae bacterium]
MIVARYVARVIVVALVCALATKWLGWWSLPLVGFTYGATDRRARMHGTIAAAGAVLGWLAILGAEAARGANVRAVAEHVGAVLSVPGFVFALITLVFAAVLAGTAAVLGAGSVRMFSGSR